MGDGCEKRCRALVLLTAILLVFTGCLFGPSRFRGVTSYRSGKVYLRNDRFYRVGKLSKGWNRFDSGARAIAFYHPQYRSTIFTGASCKELFDDAPPEVLVSRLVGRVEKSRTLGQKTFDLDGRAAIRKHLQGEIDGAAVDLDMVVIKKHDCVFDFAAVAPPKAPMEVTNDFEAFFSGFHYE